MKILYIANHRLPTDKAHGIQIANMCSAFANSGNEAELIAPKRRTDIKEDIFEYYSLENNFSVKYLPVIDLVGTLPKLGFWLETMMFARQIKRYLSESKPDFVVYSRDIFSLSAAYSVTRDIIFEAHDLPQRRLEAYLPILKKIKIVCISRGLMEELVANGVPKNNILVAPDGVDLDKFSTSIEQHTAQGSLGIKSPAVMYVGHLYSWKGAAILAQTAKLLPDYNFYFVGGAKSDIANFTNNHQESNIHFLGHQSHDKIPTYMAAADVLVLPNTGEQKISRLYTSPLKMFEYMAAKRIIVASDLPSIREILNDKNALIVKPGDPSDLAKAINKAVEQANVMQKLADQASNDVQKYSWKERAKRILSFIS